VRLALAALTNFGVACADDDRTFLPTATVTDGSALRDVASATDPGALAAVEDAMTRLLPSLSDAGAAEPLQAALATLQRHQEAGNAEAARGAATAVESAIVAYERRAGSESPDSPDLDAVRLALDGVMR
jgi:hypothetical protein